MEEKENEVKYVDLLNLSKIFLAKTYLSLIIEITEQTKNIEKIIFPVYDFSCNRILLKQ